MLIYRELFAVILNVSLSIINERHLFYDIEINVHGSKILPSQFTEGVPTT